MHTGAVVLITGGALLVGLLLWSGLAFWHKRQPLSLQTLFTIVFVAGIVCRLVYVFFTPAFYAPDEQSHFNYVKYLAEKRSFPVLTKGLGDPANEWEYHQPPLYYLGLVPVYAVVEAIFHNPAVTINALRICSLLLWLANVQMGFVLLRRLAIKDELLILCPVVFGCLLPTYTFVSSTINNDNLLIAMATGVMCLMTRAQPTVNSALALGVLLGLSLLVKHSAAVLVFAVGLMFLLLGFRKLMSWRAVVLQLGIIFGVAALFFAPWAARNWRFYGTFTPEGLSVAHKTWPSMVDGILSAAHNMTKTFWSVSGISNDVGYPFPLFGMCFGLLALAGLILGRKQNRTTIMQPLNGLSGPVLVALSAAILVNAILVLRLGYLYGMGQGRHLFGLLYPIALLLAWGLKAIPANHPTVHLVGFWVTYCIAFTAFSVSRFPQ